ncbi:MAG: SDR family oxidoreductase [Chitinophagales bacterium]
MQYFKEKTIWITGASEGIGKALALQLAEEGASIILTARNVAKLQEVQAELKGEGHLIWPMDLLETDKIGAAVEEVLQKVNSIDILINNAGISQRSLVKDTRLEVDRKIMELDYFSVITLTKALLPHFLQRKSGHIVTLSSIAGKLGTPMRSAYCAAKHAVIGFMDSLRAEVHGDNIQVLVITPGSVQTNISKNALEGDGKKHGVTDKAIANGIAVEKCAAMIVKSIKSNDSELLIAGGKEKMAAYLRRFAPSLLFKMMRSVKTT